MVGRSKPVEFTTRRFEKQGDTEGKVTCSKTGERINKEREGLLNLDKSIMLSPKNSLIMACERSAVQVFMRVANEKDFL